MCVSRLYALRCLPHGSVNFSLGGGGGQCPVRPDGLTGERVLVADELHLIGPNEAGRGAQKFQFTFDGRQWVETDFRMRVGHDSAGMPVVQKIAHAGREASGRLQQEVAIGRMLLRRIGKNEYPTCLSRLIGYNPGITDNSGTQAPYAVFTYQQGTLADLSGELPLRPDLFLSLIHI